MDGVEGPPTTELANAPGAAAAIADPGLGEAAAMAADPFIIVAIAGAPNGMELAGFVPLVLSSIFVCAGAVCSITDDRWDSVAGVLMVTLAFFFFEGFRPDSEAGEIVAPSFTPGKVESTGRTGLRSECRDAEGEPETGCVPPSCA